MFEVKEKFVVAYADGSYSTDLQGIFEDLTEEPGSGRRKGQWHIENGKLYTRAHEGGSFTSQYFNSYTTGAGGNDHRLTGCFSTTDVPYGNNFVFTIVFGEICFSTDGTYTRKTEVNVGGAAQEETATGSYIINGYALYLTEGSLESRSSFAILAGSLDAPTSILVLSRRYFR